MAKVIRILIADDHPIVRKGLRLVLSNEEDIQVVGEAEDGSEAVSQAQALKPDVILMDLQMPKMTGVQAIAEIKKTNQSVRILVLTSFADDDKVFPAIKNGASGYLLKDTLPVELLKAIRDIAAGLPSLHPVIAEKMMHELISPTATPAPEEKLTNREIEVLKFVAQGANNQEIAQKLVVSERTISTHISNILNKLHLANRTQAALYAVSEGLVDSPAKTKKSST
jgi:two-component system, NarL family, response regulator LiaR